MQVGDLDVTGIIYIEIRWVVITDGRDGWRNICWSINVDVELPRRGVHPKEPNAILRQFGKNIHCNDLRYHVGLNILASTMIENEKKIFRGFLVSTYCFNTFSVIDNLLRWTIDPFISNFHLIFFTMLFGIIVYIVTSS